MYEYMDARFIVQCGSPVRSLYMDGQWQNKEPNCHATYIFGPYIVRVAVVDFGLFAIIITARSPKSSSSVPARTLFKCKMNCVDSRSLVDMSSKMRRKTERRTHTHASSAALAESQFT